jgi:hypothetical protein
MSMAHSELDSRIAAYAFKALDEEERQVLVDEMDKNGINDGYSIHLLHAPRMLQNVMNLHKSETDTMDRMQKQTTIHHLGFEVEKKENSCHLSDVEEALAVERMRQAFSILSRVYMDSRKLLCTFLRDGCGQGQGKGDDIILAPSMSSGSVHQAGALRGLGTTLAPLGPLGPLQLGPSASMSIGSVHQAGALGGLGSNLRMSSEGGSIYKTRHGVFAVSCYALSLCPPDKINHDKISIRIGWTVEMHDIQALDTPPTAVCSILHKW